MLLTNVRDVRMSMQVEWIYRKQRLRKKEPSLIEIKWNHWNRRDEPDGLMRTVKFRSERMVSNILDLS